MLILGADALMAVHPRDRNHEKFLSFRKRSREKLLVLDVVLYRVLNIMRSRGYSYRAVRGLMEVIEELIEAGEAEYRAVLGPELVAKAVEFAEQGADLLKALLIAAAKELGVPVLTDETFMRHLGVEVVEFSGEE